MIDFTREDRQAVAEKVQIVAASAGVSELRPGFYMSLARQVLPEVAPPSINNLHPSAHKGALIEAAAKLILDETVVRRPNAS